MQEPTTRRDRSSWFFSQPYLHMANNGTLEAREMGSKGLGLIAKRPIPRRNVVCYYPAVCRRADEDEDATYAMQILTEKGNVVKRKVCDIPLNGDAHELAPRWRNKPVLGHLVNEAKGDERVNAAIVFLIDNRPRDRSFFYVPLVATKDIAAGEEIRIDYGPHYNRSHFDVASPEAPTLPKSHRDPRRTHVPSEVADVVFESASP